MADAPWVKIAPELELFWQSDAVQQEKKRRYQRFMADEVLPIEQVQYLRGWLQCFEWLRTLAAIRAANQGRIQENPEEERADVVPATRSLRSSYPV